mmetsp:Transcript_33107/g.102230  ORF Transcript_33107/g.102230 Transcript_33107/m.102230 type:complete len:227 (+) Transcript_33107:60-740(+)
MRSTRAMKMRKRVRSISLRLGGHPETVSMRSKSRTVTRSGGSVECTCSSMSSRATYPRRSASISLYIPSTWSSVNTPKRPRGTDADVPLLSATDAGVVEPAEREAFVFGSGNKPGVDTEWLLARAASSSMTKSSKPAGAADAIGVRIDESAALIGDPAVCGVTASTGMTECFRRTSNVAGTPNTWSDSTAGACCANVNETPMVFTCEYGSGKRSTTRRLVDGVMST